MRTFPSSCTRRWSTALRRGATARQPTGSAPPAATAWWTHTPDPCADWPTRLLQLSHMQWRNPGAISPATSRSLTIRQRVAFFFFFNCTTAASLPLRSPVCVPLPPRLSVTPYRCERIHWAAVCPRADNFSYESTRWARGTQLTPGPFPLWTARACACAVSQSRVF